MIRIREARTDEGPALADLFLQNPLRANTEFILDRSPDFFALLRLRGAFRTFVAESDGHFVGTATALWREGRDGAAVVRVGEVADLRVVRAARGGRAAALLLGAVREALEAAGVAWIVCLIGDANRDALGLVRGGAGLPPLAPLARHASVHYVVIRARIAPRPRGITVQAASPGDAGSLRALLETTTHDERLAPLDPFAWPDPTGVHRAWIARDAPGDALGALVVWDGNALRRIRIARYSLADLPLRLCVGVAAAVGAAVPLPGEGGVLKMWASRAMAVVGARADFAGELVRVALADAAVAGIHVVQINVPERDPLRGHLPMLPRSTYWSTLYGWCRSGYGPASHSENFHADLALV
jgi:hypothetical protein